MAQEKPDSSPFDLDRLRELVEMMEKHDLRMVKLRKGEESWVLRRGAQEVASAAAAPYAPAAPAMLAPMAPQSPPAPVAGAASAGGTATESEAGIPIKSPTVGTFYSSPQPGDPPFVKVGDRVTPDKIVCILEAMKVFNQIPAGVSGTIIKVLLKDGDAVDYGQALFLVSPA